jgi:hypothetical protein
MPKGPPLNPSRRKRIKMRKINKKWANIIAQGFQPEGLRPFQTMGIILRKRAM